MVEYTTKDAVISLFEKWSDGYAYIEIPVQDAIRQVSATPPADVRPVVRGRWEISCDGWYPYCPVCKEEPPGRTMTPFCPMCGADLRGGDTDG